MISAGLTSPPQDEETMLFPTLQTPSQLSEHRSLQELVRILDFHSLETVVLQHFCIRSKHKDKVYYLYYFMRSRKQLSCRVPQLSVSSTRQVTYFGGAGCPAMSAQHLTMSD